MHSGTPLTHICLLSAVKDLVYSIKQNEDIGNENRLYLTGVERGGGVVQIHPSQLFTSDQCSKNKIISNNLYT